MSAPQPILMPKLGLTMTEGLLAEWKVAAGDRVNAGDVIFIVETDKISNEVEAAEAGVVETLHAEAGDTVPVGDVVATFIGEGAHPAAGSDVAEPRGRLIATPLARRMAAGAGVAIGSVTGSGPRGRIMADDVTAALAAVPAAGPIEPVVASAERGEVRPLGPFQKVAARRLTASKRDIPHFYIFSEADVTELLELRTRLNADAAFARLTVNHFLITAVARALGTMPDLNRVWTEEGLLALVRVDVGLAVEGPNGLVAPVLRDLRDCSVDEVAQAAMHMVERARAGQLSRDDLEGGATTISNVGMFGATGLLPIINPGQSSILGVGANQPQFRPDEHLQPRLRQILSLSLSCDHRVIDGAIAARFLQSIRNGLEAPLTLLRRPLRRPVE